jgi:hypothetical protein
MRSSRAFPNGSLCSRVCRLVLVAGLLGTAACGSTTIVLIDDDGSEAAPAPPDVDAGADDAGTTTGPGSLGGSTPVNDGGDGGATANGGGDAGTTANGGADAGASAVDEFCVTAPWTDSPAQFVAASGATILPAGTYTLRYMGGAQSHDDEDEWAGGCGEAPGASPTCYEVTAHYAIDGLEAGHHIYNGTDPVSSTTSVWLDADGLVGNLPSVAAVEQANAGHTWPLTTTGGPLFITYYDNDYGGNVGPGSRFCLDPGAYHDVSNPQNWMTLDTASVKAGGGAGTAFDGRYLYVAPGGDEVVHRYDTRASFAGAGSWTAFDLSALDASAGGFRGAAFDGRYVYFVPYNHADGSFSGTVSRYDTRASFDDKGGWSTFDVSTLKPAAAAFVGAVFDGQYIYLVPLGGNGVASGGLARYDTRADFTAASSWATFDTKTVDPNAIGYYGATFDGRYVYLSPYADSQNTYNGHVTRYDTTASLTAASSWSVFDTTTLNPTARGYFGATFDGRYAYFVPYRGDGSQDSLVARYDTTSDFASKSSWSLFDTAPLGVSAQGAVFDGRFVYLVPSGPAPGCVNGRTARFDTLGSFTSPGSWETFDTGSLDGHWGGAFDGEYVYFVGDNFARFDARSPPLMPAAYHGSFF